MVSEAIQKQLQSAINNPLDEGYLTYTGYRLTQAEAAQYNRYTEQAAKPSNSVQAVEFYLNQRHHFLVLCCETA